MRLFTLSLVVLSLFSVALSQEKQKSSLPYREDSLKKDIDRASGAAFPIREIFSRAISVKSERFDGTSAGASETSQLNEALQKELGLQWTHRIAAKNFECVLYRYPSSQSAYAAFRELVPSQLGFVAERVDEERNIWTDASGTRIVFWMQEEAGSLRLLDQVPSGSGDAMAAKEIAREIASKLDAWHKASPNYEPDFESPPFVVRKLLSTGCNPASVRYALGRQGLTLQRDTLNDRTFEEFPVAPGAEFAWGDYDASSPFSRLIIAEYPTPQDATAALESVNQRVNALPDSERILRFVSRRGNFILQAYDVRDAMQAATLTNKIEYDYVVRWLGDSPYAQARAAAEEAAIRRHNRDTAQVIVSTFQLIGVSASVMIVIGLAVGGGYFFWRRRQGVGFTERGGMMQLNLNEELELPNGLSEVKKLKNGNQ